MQHPGLAHSKLLYPLCCPGPQNIKNKIRYTEHISYTRSNNPQVAYAVHTVNNCHAYDPGDEIMGLASPFTEGRRITASENFHMHLHKCTVKVRKPPIIRVPSLQTLEVTHDIQVCHAYNSQAIKVKSKVIPLQAWTGTEGSRRLRLPDFKTVGI